MLPDDRPKFTVNPLLFDSGQKVVNRVGLLAFSAHICRYPSHRGSAMNKP
jgi:hypothetical protein